MRSNGSKCHHRGASSLSVWMSNQTEIVQCQILIMVSYFVLHDAYLQSHDSCHQFCEAEVYR